MNNIYVSIGLLLSINMQAMNLAEKVAMAVLVKGFKVDAKIIFGEGAAIAGNTATKGTVVAGIAATQGVVMGATQGQSIIKSIYLGNANHAYADSGESKPLFKSEPSYIHIPERLPTSGMKTIRGKFPTEITDLISYMKDREKFDRMGACMPSGILMVGKPGTGKTHSARAIAEDVGLPFMHESAGNFEREYAGSGQKALNRFFDEAEKEARKSSKRAAMIFLDEIDALGSRNNLNAGGASVSYRQLIAALLTRLDGGVITDRRDIITIYCFAATNDASNIDPALLRPGRFDRIVEISLPDADDRKDILMHYARAIRYHKDKVSFDKLALLTEGHSGAEIKTFGE